MHMCNSLLQQDSWETILQYLVSLAYKIYGNPYLWLVWDLLKVKLFLNVRQVVSIYIFLMYLVIATCQWGPALVWHVLVWYMPAISRLLLLEFQGKNLFLKKWRTVPLIQVTFLLKWVRTCTSAHKSLWILLWQLHSVLAPRSFAFTDLHRAFTGGLFPWAWMAAWRHRTRETQLRKVLKNIYLCMCVCMCLHLHIHHHQYTFKNNFVWPDHFLN